MKKTYLHSLSKIIVPGLLLLLASCSEDNPNGIDQNFSADANSSQVNQSSSQTIDTLNSSTQGSSSSEDDSFNSYIIDTSIVATPSPYASLNGLFESNSETQTVRKVINQAKTNKISAGKGIKVTLDPATFGYADGSFPTSPITLTIGSFVNPAEMLLANRPTQLEDGTPIGSAGEIFIQATDEQGVALKPTKPYTVFFPELSETINPNMQLFIGYEVEESNSFFWRATENPSMEIVTAPPFAPSIAFKSSRVNSGNACVPENNFRYSVVCNENIDSMSVTSDGDSLKVVDGYISYTNSGDNRIYYNTRWYTTTYTSPIGSGYPIQTDSNCYPAGDTTVTSEWETIFTPVDTIISADGTLLEQYLYSCSEKIILDTIPRDSGNSNPQIDSTNISWKTILNADTTYFTTMVPDTIYNQGYALAIEETLQYSDISWINCDYFWRNPAILDTVLYTVHSSILEIVHYQNYVIYPSINSMVRLYDQNVNVLESGETYVVSIGYGETTGALYFGSLTFTDGRTDQQREVTLTPSTEEQIRQFLQDL